MAIVDGGRCNRQMSEGDKGTMLIARAPLRVSFGGGGTDIEAYYAKYGGVVLSASINKYIYGIVTNNFDSHFQIISADYQSVFNVPSSVFGNVHGVNGNGRAAKGVDGLSQPNETLRLPRAAMEHFELDIPVNVFTAAEVPPGTGLGSSGATAVNLATIFSALSERAMAKEQIAEAAFFIEVKKLGAPVGKQDQYASAFGGINFFQFEKDAVSVEPLRVPWATAKKLERRLMLFFTGNSRQAWKILQQQQASTAKDDEAVISSLHQIKALAFEMKKVLENDDLPAFGELLDESWQHKKRLSTDISNLTIDEAYESARLAGAAGGKITGAGGGGFLLLYCEEEHQASVRAALEVRGLHEMHFAFEFQGARVLVNTGSLSRESLWIGR
ncbi:MAG: GHMP kinase [Chloroflexi bacterium]|nr:GHMP kinase [Chloroflexota bacterium]